MEVDSNSLVSSVTGDDDAVSTVETGNSYSSTAGTNHHHHPSDALEKHGQWLTSIPRDEVEKLKGDKAYLNFLNAFEGLKRAHHRMRQREANISECGIREGHCCQSFLHNFSDDIVLRMFDYLDTRGTARMMKTCHRFHLLGTRSVQQRTQRFASCRMLHNLKLLRAQEQYRGINPASRPFVQVPMLGLTMRVLVVGTGDPDFNGLYFCTGCNGNGHMFTKPRFRSGANDDPLQCIMAKRFSGEQILWYMSKQVVNPRTNAIVEVFSYVSDISRLLT